MKYLKLYERLWPYIHWVVFARRLTENYINVCLGPVKQDGNFVNRRFLIGLEFLVYLESRHISLGRFPDASPNVCSSKLSNENQELMYYHCTKNEVFH